MASIRRIVVLGKSGVGKSSLCNTILGGSHATAVGGSHTNSVTTSPNSETRVCRAVTKKLHQRTVTVIDTPGFLDTRDPVGFRPEIMRCLEECAPGPHSFLLVLRVERFTPQECAVVDLFLNYFSPGALRFTTIVFTHGDDLQGLRIEDWAKQNDCLRNLLQKCGNRCHVVDNRHWVNQNQVQDLLNTIDHATKANDDSFYTNDVLQNQSLWERFKGAPLEVQIAAFLGVPAVGCLLYATVPWADVSQWMKEGAARGTAWVWKNIPAEKDIQEAIVYLSTMERMLQKMCDTTEVVKKSTSFCAVI